MKSSIFSGISQLCLMTKTTTGPRQGDGNPSTERSKETTLESRMAGECYDLPSGKLT